MAFRLSSRRGVTCRSARRDELVQVAAAPLGQGLDPDVHEAPAADPPLAAAALDVTGIEPLPADSSLWKTPNLFITPHTSAISERLWHRETELFLKVLDEWFSGKELSNRVDFSRGY
jgi:hypothetical protein